MKCQRSPKLPTARHIGQIELCLLVGRKVIQAETAKSFFLEIIRFIEEEGKFWLISIPFHTTGQNFLISTQPFHPSGREFAAYETFRIGSRTYYLNTVHPRFYALRLGVHLLEAAGFHPTLMQAFD